MADQGTLVLGAETACCVLAVAALLYAKLKDLDRQEAALACVRSDSASYLNSAEIVLKDPATPPAVRRMVLLALQTIGSPELTRDFAEFLAEESDDAPDVEGAIDREIRALQRSRPDLADRAQEAAFGLLLCAPIVHADRLRVEVVREGATRPSQIWARLGAGLTKLWPDPKVADEGSGLTLAGRS